MKPDRGLYMVFAIVALCIASFVFAVYVGVVGEYQDSVLLFGIGFIVLAFVMFAYRIVRYPDTGRRSQITSDEEPSSGDN